GSLALRPAALLALLSELTGFLSSQRGRLLPGFRWFGHPPHRRISLQRQLGNMRWRDFHPRDHQLASLHDRSNLLTRPNPLYIFALHSARRNDWPVKPRQVINGNRHLVNATHGNRGECQFAVPRSVAHSPQGARPPRATRPKR